MQTKIVLAFVATVFIWSTTPIAIQWSQDRFTSIQALFWRMFLAWLGLFFFLAARRQLPKLRPAILVLFCISGGGLFAAMSLIYISAPYLDSGIIAIIHGVQPLLTALFALLLLGIRLSKIQWLSLMTSFFGMIVLFSAEGEASANSQLAFIGVLVAVLFHSLTAVLIKRYGVKVAVPHQLLGALSVTTLCLGVWLAQSSAPLLPTTLSQTSVVSITYLALVGSIFGFLFYYFLLKQISPVTVGTITLITPVTSMVIGAWLANEHFPTGTLVGTTILLVGLASYLLVSQKSKK